jgi:hypothetical protein
MSACGSGYGSLDPAFADRIELELVYRELQLRLELPCSREVFCEEHRRECARRGRRVAYRDVLARLVGE